MYASSQLTGGSFWSPCIGIRLLDDSHSVTTNFAFSTVRQIDWSIAKIAVVAIVSKVGSVSAGKFTVAETESGAGWALFLKLRVQVPAPVFYDSGGGWFP